MLYPSATRRATPRRSHPVDGPDYDCHGRDAPGGAPPRPGSAKQKESITPAEPRSAPSRRSPPAPPPHGKPWRPSPGLAGGVVAADSTRPSSSRCIASAARGPCRNSWADRAGRPTSPGIVNSANLAIAARRRGAAGRDEKAGPFFPRPRPAPPRRRHAGGG